MARPKNYNDEFLTSHAESFWMERCRHDPRQFTFSAFSAYLASSANIHVSADTLKHNKILHKRIDELKAGSAPATYLIPASCESVDSLTQQELERLSVENEKLKSFISRTYVHDICCQLLRKELGLQMQTIVKEESANRSIITASMEPFNSPILNELAAMFGTEEEQDEKNI